MNAKFELEIADQNIVVSAFRTPGGTAENERKRIEAEQFAQAEAARKAEEARLADVEHRRQINREALEAIKGVCPELSEPQVKLLVGAIISGLIPHVSIKY